MNGNYKFEQDNLFLQLKNMPKPPISKEMAKELGFDSKKFEVVIDKLLYQISEVRKERMKENYIFEEKMKIMENSINPNGQIKNKINNMKNKNKLNTKNNKINLNRPKSNYKSIKSSGYGIAPKKVNIFSSRGRKKTKDNIKNNNIPSQKVMNKRNLINIPNNKNNNSLNIKNVKNKTINNNINNNKLPNNTINNEKIENNINNKLNNDMNIINPNKFTFKDIVNEIDKIKIENQIIEDKYKNIPDNSINSFNTNNDNINKSNKISEEKQINNILNSKNIYYKNNSELINKNIQLIIQRIINDLLYELIIDLKNIEEKEKIKEKNDWQNDSKNMIKNDKLKNTNNINLKFQVELNNAIIEKCNKNKENFKKYMKLKGSFFTNNIFEIYDNFVEEMSKEIFEQGLDYYIKQMDDFIKKMENNK